MSPAHILFKRALAEKLAFVELPPGAQAAGPGGAPVDPAAGGAPMDPAMGAPPADPMAAGMPPMDPAAGGMPPMDPAAAGMPPADPMAAAPMDPMAGIPTEPPAEEVPEEPVNDPATDVDKDNKPDTMVPMSAVKDFAIGVIEAMKGKKTQDAASPDVPKPEAQDPMSMPGPVTGMPGFDPASMSGGFKTASVLTKFLKSAATPKRVDVSESTNPGEGYVPDQDYAKAVEAQQNKYKAPAKPATRAVPVTRKK